VWVEEAGLKRDRAFYNVHALQLRSLSAYALRSREFASAFRQAFAPQRAEWPAVSTDRGPQTLLEGWIPADDSLADSVLQLIERFVPLAEIVDGLLADRKTGGARFVSAR
jgi:hypothetical protein